MTIQEIPLVAGNQTFAITLNQTEYNFRILWRASRNPCWVLDIADSANTPLLSGVPMLPGINLLGQHKHLAIGGNGILFIGVDGDVNAVPSWDNLGSTAHLYWVPPS